MKILQLLIKNKYSHVENCIPSIHEYDSFGEYLNMMAVERIRLPFYYKLLNRSYNIEEKKVLAEVYNKENNLIYTWFAKGFE